MEKKRIAIIDQKGRMCYHTEGFTQEEVCSQVPLSNGDTLLLCDPDERDQEISSLRMRLSDAEEANMAKETFLSNMSHDIRTPMNAIVGMTALAKNHIDEKGRVKDALSKIEMASSHLLSLINDVLDMSRINSGRMQIANKRFSLSDLIYETMTIVKPQIEGKHHSYELKLDQIDVETLFGDALRLRQMYVNIINNAVKYTPENGNIVLSISEDVTDDQCVLIFSCRDNGIGMTPEFLKRIYDPFERAESTTISKIEGTGLGMSIVRKITEAMSGTISITSEVGKGTTVSLRIPMAYEKEKVQTASLKGKHLLILEADEAIAEIYHRYLHEAEVEHTIVNSASEALSVMTEAEFQGKNFDAAIIGKEQKDSGTIYDIAGYLHRSRPNMTLILISEEKWEQIEYRANRSGITSFIPLPFFRNSLINGLNRAIQEASGEETAKAYPDLSGKRILLVEDNLINREIAREILSMTTAAVDDAENGQRAVELFASSAEGAYSLILMDIQMPVLDGYGATKAIRALERKDAKTIPIYAMTANTFAEDVAKARNAGMNGHIAKPIDMNALMQVLKSIED